MIVLLLIEGVCILYQITASKSGDALVVRKSLEIGVNPDAKEKDTVSYIEMHSIAVHANCVHV